jgi:predicted MFS family arabinose efflux permease
VGVAVGPVLGGALVDAFGWRSVFLYRAPLAAALGAAALAMAPRSRPEGATSRRGLALRDVARLDVLLPGLLTFLSSSAQFSVWLLIPFYLLSSQALSATAGGVLFALSPLGTALASPVSGWAADRLGTRWPVVIGLVIEMAGLAIISQLAADSSLVLAVAGLLCVGLGVGVFQVANLAQMMAAFPRTQQGVAGGLAFLARALGSAAGVQVSAAMFGARAASVGFMPAFQSAFVGAAAVAGVAAALALGWALGRGRDRRLAL